MQIDRFCQKQQRNIDSNLAMMEVSAQSDISDQLRTVHQVCEESVEKAQQNIKAQHK